MKPHLLVGILALMAGLFTVDKFLAAIEHNEIHREAEALAAEGEHLLRAGQVNEALTPLRRAYMMVRDSRRSELTFARALTASGKLPEAGDHLRHLLELDPNDGATNLAMARLQVRLGNNPDAEAYYHRAEYGRWTGAKQVIPVRNELVRFLAEHNEQKALLSELLILEDESSHTLQTQKELAHLFLVAGSPARAATMYRSALQRDPNDAESFSGLADTQLATGDYPAALSSLHQARLLRPEDANVVHRIELATRLTALDPTPRRLPSRQKYERSLRVLQLAAADFAQCAAHLPSDDQSHSLLARANAAQQQTSSPATNELSESILTLAQELWKTRSERCASAAPANELLTTLMEKIGK